MQAKDVPFEQCLRKVLHLRFNMCYRRASNARFKFQDPTFNEKRLWVSRLLAQFYTQESDNVLLISIDECSFRSDKTIHSAWGQVLDLGKNAEALKKGLDIQLKTSLLAEQRSFSTVKGLLFKSDSEIQPSHHRIDLHEVVSPNNDDADDQGDDDGKKEVAPIKSSKRKSILKKV